MTKENVLILGNGGREHALCWKLSKSPYLKQLYCIPGNGGIESLAQTDTSVDIMNFEAVKQFAIDHEIGLIVIGKENPLVSGIVDFFKKNTEIKVFGPNQHAASLEGSKIFAKNFFMKHDIPTAPYHTFFFQRRCYLLLAFASGLSGSDQSGWVGAGKRCDDRSK